MSILEKQNPTETLNETIPKLDPSFTAHCMHQVRCAAPALTEEAVVQLFLLEAPQTPNGWILLTQRYVTYYLACRYLEKSTLAELMPQMADRYIQWTSRLNKLSLQLENAFLKEKASLKACSDEQIPTWEAMLEALIKLPELLPLPEPPGLDETPVGDLEDRSMPSPEKPCPAEGPAMSSTSVQICGAKLKVKKGKKKRCQAPAMSNGRCPHHGGCSTGPKTPEGLSHSQTARLTHGAYSASTRQEEEELRALMDQARQALKQNPPTP